MGADLSEFLWTEEVAELAGLTPTSVRVKASQSKAKSDRGALKPSDLPLPYDRAPREVNKRGGGTRTVLSPRWRRVDILAWLPRRIPVGNPTWGVRAGG